MAGGGIYESSDDPPCPTCMPELLSENEEIVFAYQVVRSQYIMGFSGPVSINQMAIWKIIDEYKIIDRIRAFESVLNLSNHMLSLELKKNE